MSEARRLRIVILSNSQGTSAGLAPGVGYPAMLQQLLQDKAEVHRLLISGWTLRDVVLALDDNVLALKPDLVILQFGIVEATQRILSSRAKSFFASVPLGGHITKLLYSHRARVLHWRKALGLPARIMRPTDFGNLLAQVIGALAANGAAYRLIRMPCIPDAGASMRHPFINQDIALFNKEMDRYDSLSLEERIAGWNEQCIQPGTVHFTETGHRAVASLLHEEVQKLLPLRPIEH